jgi:rhodanese-related sulfurtransferase
MQDISVQELSEKRKKGDVFLLVDVREPYEYDEFNIGGQLVPLGELQGVIDDWDEWQEKEIVVHCRSGARSAAAKGFLIQNGFKNVRNLQGGILAWIDAFGENQ